MAPKPMSLPPYTVTDVGSRRELLKDLFLEVSELPAASRADFLAGLTGLTSGELAELRRLLHYEESAERFFHELSVEIGSLASAEQAFLPDDLVAGRFRIRRFIARGGMGEVYEADDLELKDRVAVKVLRAALARSDSFIERFRREIRLARGISSPHVCRVYDVARHTREDGQDVVFFTMEMLDGETLAAGIRREGPLPCGRAARLIRQMIDGLAAAHRAGVIHRDFKSANVMVCAGGGDSARAVITDFGLAHSLVDTTGEVADRAATPAYAAPEQLSGQPQTAAADVFALGVVLYEMMTGRLPFEGIQRGSFLPPRRLRTDLPPRWEAAILRCLAARPEDRFQSVEEFAEALGVSDALPQTNRRGWLIAAASGVVAGGSWLAWRRWGAVPSMPVLAILPFELGDGASEDQRQLAGGIADRVADLLCQVPGLRVLSRSATQRAVRGTHGAMEAAASLGAGQVLAGRLDATRTGARVRFELAQIDSRAVLWSQTSDVAAAELEATYRNAVQAIVGVLHLAPPAPSGAPLTRNPLAYEAYLKARFLMEQRQFAAARMCLELAGQAVALDPGFAKAQAVRGLALEFLSAQDGAGRPQLLARAREAAQTAVALDGRCGEAFVVLALIQQYWDWDRAGAESNFRRAIECNQGAAIHHQTYARHLSSLERHAEALREISAAASLDPLSPTVRGNRGSVLLYAGQVDEAIEQYRGLVADQPGRPTAYIPLADCYEAKGDLPKAIEAAREGVKYSKEASFAISQLGHACAAAGQDPEARDILRNLEQRYAAGQCKANEVAAVHAGWKDRDRTLDWLERGVPAREMELTLLRVGVAYRFLHDIPRFHELLRTVRL